MVVLRHLHDLFLTASDCSCGTYEDKLCGPLKYGSLKVDEIFADTLN